MSVHCPARGMLLLELWRLHSDVFQWVMAEAAARAGAAPAKRITLLGEQLMSARGSLEG